MDRDLFFLSLENVPILTQLRIEEALLRADERNWCLFNHGSTPSIVMGISGIPDKLIDMEKMKTAPLPLIRRFSGGGTVVVDENTCFVTLICNEKDTHVPCFPKQVLDFNGSLYQNLLPNVQIRENDYTINDLKFGGNAQYLTKSRWLHHTTLLYDYDPLRMSYLKLPEKRPAYRKERPHEEFLSRLCQHLPSKIDLFSRLQRQLAKQFTLHPVSIDQIEEILSKPHRKSTRQVFL